MKRLAKIILMIAVVIVAGGLLLMQVLAGSRAPIQPIEFNHWQHLTKEEGPQLECVFCHEHADKSAHATIPSLTTCMACHESTMTDSPEVQKLTTIFKQGAEPKWRRVYWMEPSANVFFTHKPHISAGVECVSCHGDVGQMRQMRREVDQTMGWCIDCHRKKGASIDCYICHR